MTQPQFFRLTHFIRFIGCLALLGAVVAHTGCDGIEITDPSTGSRQKPLSKPDCKHGRCPLEVPKKYGPIGLMDLPEPMREPNYSGGSCVHASMVTVLRWQGEEALADWWRNSYRGGEYSHGLITKAEEADLRFAYTNKGDADFLDWVSRTNRGAVIFYYPRHSIVFRGYESGKAVLLDNNRISQRIEIPKQQFIREWKGYGGFALTPILTPAAPEPH